MKSEYSLKIEKLEAKLSGLDQNDINIKNLLDKGIDVLLKLDNVYETADIDKKRDIINSMFPEKMHFENNSLRTGRLNEAVRYIYMMGNDLDGNKKGQNGSDSILSFQVRKRRFELPCQLRRYHLKVVRLPVSPPPHFGNANVVDCG